MKRKAIVSMVCALALAACGLAGCGADAADQQAAAEIESAVDAAVEELDTASEEAVEEAASVEEAGPVEVDPKTVDYSNIDMTIENGDSATMSQFAQDIWLGSYDGKVIKIDGLAEKLGSWCIMEDNGDGSKVGIGFELVDSEDYPMDGAHVEMVGVIAPGGSMEGARILYVLPENMKVLD